MKDEALENSVVSLFAKAWSIRRISREFAVSRNRVRRILERNQLVRQTGGGSLKYKVLDARSIENFLSVNAQKKNEVKLLPNKKERAHGR